MENIKISFITTIFNEEENIKKLLESLLVQTKKPYEIIIVDGNSIDKTVAIIRGYDSRIKKAGINLKLIIKEGNRSAGRNEAIRNSKGDRIVCSDAGCVLHKDWIKNIIKHFDDKKVDVVAGYYEGIGKNIFQRCLIPYVLVMPDKVNADTFLPATRSIAFTKNIWKKINGFPEQFSNNEDYVFARHLKRVGAKIIFEKKAISYWIPRNNIKEAFWMFFHFAKGDAESGIFRPKAVLIFARYILGVGLLVWNIEILLLSLIVYLIWAVAKNYRYVKDFRAILVLPTLQIISDLAVLSGTMAGMFKVWDTKKKQ